MPSSSPITPGQLPWYGILLSILLLVGCQSSESQWDHRGWQINYGDNAGSRYSELDQINRSNVDQLEVAWMYHTGDHRKDPPSTIENTPIIIDSVMYVTSPMLKVIAVDAQDGTELWRFDPFESGRAHGVNRGVMYWRDGSDQRILFTAGEHLYALDATTGNVIPTFGDSGTVDLHTGLGQNLERDISDLTVMASSPGIIYNDLVIMGAAVSEGPQPSIPGHIRAFNVRTGELEWVFHTIPQPGEFGYETWPEDAWKRTGGANSWGGMTLDKKRGIVFAGTGSATYDFYGGNRKGKNLFANTILALDAETGERIWHYQVVHHDLWDYDIPAPPNLVTVTHDGEEVPAVAQVTKTGYVYLLHRETGEPLFPIEERPVPESSLPGEEAWPTQPIPTKPPAFVRQGFDTSDVSTLFEHTRDSILRELTQYKYGPHFIPPSLQGSVMLPFFNGGAEWSGASFDPTTGWLYVNANDKPSVLTMVPTEGSGQEPQSAGERLYQQYCASCHGIDRSGAPPQYPPLIDINERRSRSEIVSTITSGQGMMPSFEGTLTEDQRQAIAEFLLNPEAAVQADAQQDATPEKPPVPFRHTGWNRFVGPDGYPASKPPWGTLNAINLNTGEMAWQVPLGEHAELTEKGIPPTGTENYGGTIVTEGGLVFIGATKDEKFRAFDKKTGEILWETQLPAGGYATPATYQLNGKQYVVIAAGGGGKQGTKAGDEFVAFALPDSVRSD